MRKFYFSFSIFVTVLFLSCNADLENQQTGINQSDDMVAQTFTADSTMVKNAYSVDAMKAALELIKKRASTNIAEIKGSKNRVAMSTDILNNFVVQTSHRYIKFNPSNKTEEDLLKDDSNMFLFDYRLDYEYSDEFLLNRPADSDSIPNYYTAVPVDKILPNVPYEILEELYIPEQDPYFADVVDVDEYEVTYNIQNKSDLFFTLISTVHEQANTFSNVGYIRQGISSATEQILSHDGTPLPPPQTEMRIVYGRRWRPVGRIRVEDTSKQNVRYPVEGAKVLIRQGFTITSGITNADGEFSTANVRGRAKYVLQWERHHFSIRSGYFGQAETKSPNMRAQNWNCDIIKNMDKAGWYYATIFQAAHDYYYKDILGLHRPRLNTTLGSQQKIAATQNQGKSVHLNQLKLAGVWFPHLIVLQVWDKESESVYGTTIHELAHSAHSQMSLGAYNSLVWKAYIELEAWGGGATDKEKSAKRVLESWATAVEITLTNLRYQRLGVRNQQYNVVGDTNIGNEQLVPLTFDNVSTTYYTPAYFDLTDNYNQNQYQGMPNDFVTGFTIKQVQDVVKDSKSWSEVKEKFEQQYGLNGIAARVFLSQWQ